MYVHKLHVSLMQPSVMAEKESASHLGGKALLLAASDAVVGSLHVVGELRANAEGLEGDDLKRCRLHVRLRISLFSQAV
jgi:hypothetical protein